MIEKTDHDSRQRSPFIIHTFFSNLPEVYLQRENIMNKWKTVPKIWLFSSAFLIMLLFGMQIDVSQQPPPTASSFNHPLSVRHQVKILPQIDLAQKNKRLVRRWIICSRMLPNHLHRYIPKAVWPILHLRRLSQRRWIRH